MDVVIHKAQMRETAIAQRAVAGLVHPATKPTRAAGVPVGNEVDPRIRDHAAIRSIVDDRQLIFGNTSDRIAIISKNIRIFSDVFAPFKRATDVIDLG